MKKKLLLDKYDLGIVINCLYQMRGSCTEESLERINDIIIYLIDNYECRGARHPTRKKKVMLELSECSIVIRCLIEWRNRMIEGGENGKAEIISELIIEFQ